MRQHRLFRFLRPFCILALLFSAIIPLAAQDDDDGANDGKPKIRALGVEANGVEVPVVQIRVDEFLSRQIHPLLNYVFFDDNSATIPQRYIQMTDVSVDSFRPERLFDRETLEVYYDVLNIIGYRLKNSTEAITITGCNANVGPEKGNKDLSTRRAQAVKDYFQNVWKIDPARLNLQSRDLPEKPSNSKESPLEAEAENRRVEITGAWSMVQPVFIQDTLREATPPIIRFYSKVEAKDENPAQWSIAIKQRAKALRSPISSAGNIKPVVDWKINKEKSTIPLDTVPMTYELEIRYPNLPNLRSKRLSMPVQQITIQKKKRERANDVEKDRYSMILFPFASAKVEEGNAKIVEFIKSEKRLRPESVVVITGYTDIIGSEQANLKISTDRAKSVQAALGLDKAGVVKEVKVEGRGKQKPLLYENNELPEARLYCRTVVVEVKNPATDE
ncbi:MAG: OmpA family protein [Candidatus Kapaibacteriota bacterium]|jgi:outer membrane protein OmpA-like peptidoglycan-associated protein